MEPDVPRLTVRAACGLAAKEEGRHEAAAQFAARIAQTGETAQKVVSMPDLSSDAAPNQRTLLGVPLTARGRRLGVATLGRPGDHAFRDDEVHLFRIMANRAALAIENAALHVRAERDLEMKTLLLRELQHRVRNNLQAISGILSFQLTRETTAQAAIKGALRRIKSISATQDFLFKREGGPIPLHPLLETVAHQLATLWALPGQEVQVTADHPDIALPMERAQIVALVVHELIANAFQHGLADQPGVIRLHISTQARGVTIEVLDPGHGLPPTFNMESASLAGLRLVQILLQREFRVGLELVASAGGTRASFTIPRAYFPTLPAPASMAVTGDRPSPPYPKGE
jgi:two-component system, sensor histidine kinase PdtaS